MSSQLRDAFDFLDGIGIFDVVLPFLLVFTIVFALLERTKVFGVEEWEGKKYTKKNLNSVAAFVVAFLVVASANLVEIITTVSSQFVVLLFGIVLFLLLAGSFHMEKKEGFYLSGWWRKGFMVLVFVVLLLIFLDAIGMVDNTFDILEGTSRGELLGMGLLIALLVVFIAWITQDNKHHDDKDAWQGGSGGSGGHH